VTGVQFLLDGLPLEAPDAEAPYALSWDTTTASEGVHVLTAVARDAAGHQATAAPVTVTVANPDTKAPTVAITFPAAGATLSGVLTVTATASDDRAVTAVQFLLDGQPLGPPDVEAPYAVAWDAASATEAEHTLSALASDAAGNQTSAAAIVVSVSRPDTTPPTVHVTQPANGATVSGSTVITAVASDDRAVTAVQFLLDGQPLGAPDAETPYAAAWDTTGATEGEHTVSAVASDAAGHQTAAAPVLVTIVNPDTTAPIVTVTQPASGATVSGSVAVTATASDDRTVTVVQFLLDGAPLGAPDVEAPYAVAWDTTTASEAAHTLSAVASDAAGHQATAPPVTVTVTRPDTTPPTVSILTPEGTVLSGSEVLTADASDDRGVASVQFLLDGLPLEAPDLEAPYSVPWDTLAAPDGDHQVSAEASDAAGNRTLAAPVTVTVANTGQPSAPAGVTAAAPSTGSVVLTWTASSDDVSVAGYRVYRDGGLLASVSRCKHVDFGLAPLSTHAYEVAAFDGDGNESARSAAVSATTPPVVPFRYPLAASADGLSVVDQDGRPFFINGDSAWSLIAQVPKDDAELYLENRRQKGFNLVLVSLIEHRYATNAPSTIDGIPPFLTPGDFTTPNEAYFAHADWVIDKAAEKGIVVLLDPLYLGWECAADGWCGEVARSAPGAMQGWGRYVGQRYRNRPNIIWLIGGDTDPVVNQVDDEVREFVAGLREHDTTHLVTAHNHCEDSAREPWPNEAWLTLDNVYTYYDSYLETAQSYGRTPPLPLFLLETAYENWYTTLLFLRAQAYWAVLSGATSGHIFGNCETWGFGAGYCTGSWKAQLDSAGSSQLSRVGRLFTSRAFQELVPDTAHVVLTGGYQSGDTLATTARTRDGSTVIAYVPSRRAVTIDMAKVSGSAADAWWFDPRSGQATFVGAFPTSGARAFTPPDANDWVLVIDDSSRSLPAPGY
jgi:hypothetical protein